MPKTRIDQIMDITRGELDEYRGILERHGVARVTVVIDYDYKTNEPYNVDVSVNHRRNILERSQQRSGFIVDRSKRIA